MPIHMSSRKRKEEEVYRKHARTQFNFNAGYILRKQGGYLPISSKYRFSGGWLEIVY